MADSNTNPPGASSSSNASTSSNLFISVFRIAFAFLNRWFQSIIFDSNTNHPGNSIVSSSSNTSTVPQLPIEVIEIVWQFLSIQERVKVQRVSKSWRDHSRETTTLWKNATYFSQYYTQPDICKDVKALSKMEEWTNMKFSRFAVSLQPTTNEQIAAFKKILHWLPGMEIQDLVIGSHPVSDRDLFVPYYGWKPIHNIDYKWEPNHSFDDIPGICFLPEDEAQSWRNSLARMTAKTNAETIRSSLDTLLERIEITLVRAKNRAISNCSRLRSLVLDAQDGMPFMTSWDDPISRCNLDILSLKNADFGIIVNLPDFQVVCNMVKEARVLDLIDWYPVGYPKMMINLVTAASQSLEYLTISICSKAEDREDETRILNLPRLKHLHFATNLSKLMINCPNLESLHLIHLREIYCFSSIPSVKMLFIGETNPFEAEDHWHLLEKIPADRLETLIIYNESLTLRSFLRFFSSAKELPHLQKIVVRTSGDERLNKWLNLGKFCRFSSKQLQNIRKIETLIWQYEEGDEPALSTQAFIRKHFATKLECIKTPFSSLEYSAEIMGNFVKHKSLVDKLLFFDNFLLNSQD